MDWVGEKVYNTPKELQLHERTSLVTIQFQRTDPDQTVYIHSITFFFPS